MRNFAGEPVLGQSSPESLCNAVWLAPTGDPTAMLYLVHKRHRASAAVSHNRRIAKAPSSKTAEQATAEAPTNPRPRRAQAWGAAGGTGQIKRRSAPTKNPRVSRDYEAAEFGLAASREDTRRPSQGGGAGVRLRKKQRLAHDSQANWERIRAVQRFQKRSLASFGRLSWNDATSFSCSALEWVWRLLPRPRKLSLCSRRSPPALITV